MDKLGVKIFCAAALLFSSISSYAEEYQYAVYASFSENDSNTMSSAGGFAYYFEPVDDSLGPWSIAPWLNKSSSIDLQYDHTKFPSSNKQDDGYGPDVSLRWVYDIDVYVQLIKGRWQTNFKPQHNINVTKSDAEEVIVGYFYDNLNFIELGDYDWADNKGETANNWFARTGYVHQLESGNYVNFIAGYYNLDNDDDEYDGKTYALLADYHPQKDLNLRAYFQHKDYDGVDDLSSVAIGARYFFNHSYNVGIDIAREKKGNNRYNMQRIYIGKRF